MKLPQIRNFNHKVFNTINASSRSEARQNSILVTNNSSTVRKVRPSDFGNPYQRSMNPTLKDIIKKTHGYKQVDSERSLNQNDQNELINEESLQYYIDSSFRTRGQTPLKNARWKTAFYVDEVCADKKKIMKKLTKINYNDYFGNNF